MTRTARGQLSTRLGTLPGYTDSYAGALNDRGEVVGVSYRDDGQHAFLWRHGTMVDLGTFGGLYSQPTAINNRGQVTGWAANERGEDRPFLWDNGRMVDLGGVGSFEINALNDHGQVVGTDHYHALLWEFGRQIVLPGFAPELSSEALGINNRGDVVGFSADAAGQAHAVMWQNGRLLDLGVPGVALRINEQGQVIGFYRNAAGKDQAFFWDRGQMTDVGPLGGGTGWWPGSVVWGLNDRGQAVGFGDTATDSTHAFVWKRGDLIDISLPDVTMSLGWAINNRGEVVGDLYRNDIGARPFIWADGVTSELGVLPGGAFATAGDINERGDVLGVGSDAAGRTRALLWTRREAK